MAYDYGQGFENLASEAIGAVGDLVHGYGATARNNADLQAAEIERIQLNNRLALQSAALKQQNQQEVFQLLKKGVYLITFIVISYLIYMGVKNYSKK